MLLMVEKGVRGGICPVIHRYAKTNNKYMKNYNKCLESIFVIYLDANNLYGWGMSRKLPVNGFKWVTKLSKFDEDFIKNDENSNNEYILDINVEYPKNLFNLHHNFSFLTERKKIGKFNTLFCSIHDKKNYILHIRALKQALNHGLILSTQSN